MMDARHPIRVAVVHEEARSGTALELQFADAEGFHWSGCFPSVRKAVPRLIDAAGHVVLLRMEGGRKGGSDQVALLKRLRPRAKVLVLSRISCEQILREALVAGADGFLVEPVSASEVRLAVRAVWDGDTPVSPGVVRHLVRLVRTAHQGVPDSLSLTARELEVMSHVEVGRSDKEIAVRLGLSVQTVKRHLHNVYSKLGVANRTAAMHRLRSATRPKNGEIHLPMDSHPPRTA